MNLIVSVPDHCLFFYISVTVTAPKATMHQKHKSLPWSHLVLYPKAQIIALVAFGVVPKSTNHCLGRIWCCTQKHKSLPWSNLVLYPKAQIIAYVAFGVVPKRTNHCLGRIWCCTQKHISFPWSHLVLYPKSIIIAFVSCLPLVL